MEGNSGCRRSKLDSTPARSSRKRRLIAEFADYRREQLEQRFRFRSGLATFVNQENRRRQESRRNAETVSASFIATGSVISIPNIPGLADAGCITSDELLDLHRIPPSIIVLGGGAVALESAHYLDALGSRVTIIQRSPQLLRGTDDDVAKVVENSSASEEWRFSPEDKVLRIERDGETRRVVFQHQGSEASH